VYYSDGREFHGGGEEDTETRTFTFLKSWCELPPDGVVVAVSDSHSVGRRIMKSAERYYAIPPEAEGGPDVGMTGPEISLGPLVHVHIPVVKDGIWVNDKRYHEITRRAVDNQHCDRKSAKSSREWTQLKD